MLIVLEVAMVRRIKLYARLNDNGKFSRVPVAFHKNGRAIEPVGHVTGYLMRKAGKFEHIGRDLDAAVTRLRQEEALLSGDVVPVIASSVGQRIRLFDAANDYKAEIKVLDKARGTVRNYTNAVNDFVKSCKKIYLDEIDRKDILAHMQWLRENLEARVPGSQGSTLRNRITYLGIFFNKQGIKLVKEKGTNGNAPGILFPDDRPKTMKKRPKKYDQSTIDQLLKAADVDQKDYLMFLLWSGFRDEETQYLQYTDTNWKNGTVTVHAKPHFGWKPKDSEERTITLPSEVMKIFKGRMERPQQYANGYRKPVADDIVFPSPKNGRPDSHLILRLHAVATKAGLDLKGQRAGHMFRKTAGSRIAKKLGLRAAMDFLGHADVNTTALYLAADDSNVMKSRAAYDEMFEEGD
jgi:integrase